MAGITHPFVSAIADDADTSLVRPSNWNAEHTISASAFLDHTIHLSNIGTNTHAQIDTAISASTSHISNTSNPHSVTLAQVGGTTNHTALSNIGINTHSQIDSHISSTSNPHSVTLSQVGGTTDHTALSNIGINSHSTIDSLLHSQNTDTGTSQITFTIGNGVSYSRLAFTYLSGYIESNVDGLEFNRTIITPFNTNTQVSIKFGTTTGHVLKIAPIAGGFEYDDTYWYGTNSSAVRKQFAFTDTDHGGLSGLTDDDHSQYILVSGTRAFTGNQSFGDFNITNVGTIAFDGFLQDASGVPIIGTLGVLANDDLQIVTSGGTEIMLIEGDQATLEIGRSGSVNVAIGEGASTNTYRLIVKAGAENASGIANFVSSAGNNILVIASSAVTVLPKLTVVTSGSSFVGNTGFGTASPLQPVHIVIDDAATNTILTTLRLDRTVTGGGFGAAGIGTQIEYVAEDSGGTMRRIAHLAGYLDNATSGSTTGVVKIGIRNAATATDFANAGFERMRWDTLGVIVNNDKVAACDFTVHGDTIDSVLFADVSDNACYVAGTTAGKFKAYATTGAIVQPDATTDLGTVLSNLGWRAAGTAYPITTTGAASVGSLTTTEFTVEDDGDTFWTGDGSGLYFGHMYTNTDIVVPVAVMATWYEADINTPDFTAGELNGVTLTDHYLVVPIAGRYEITHHADLKTTAAGDELASTVMVNGTATETAHGHATVAVGGAAVPTMGLTILNLAANDQISLAVQNHSAARNITITHAQVRLKQVGG